MIGDEFQRLNGGLEMHFNHEEDLHQGSACSRSE